MPTTDLGLPFPSDTTPNDFATHFEALAEALDPSTLYHVGTQTSRPAASTLPHQFYKVTDNTADGGVFLSDGTSWIRVTPSPWTAWSSTHHVTDGIGSANSPDVGANYSTSGLGGYLYRVLPGNSVEFNIEVSVDLQGTYVPCGLNFSTPISSSRISVVSATFQGDLAVAQVQDSYAGNVVALLPHTGFAAKDYQFNTSGVYMGRWYVNVGPKTLRVNGTYSV